MYRLSANMDNKYYLNDVDTRVEVGDDFMYKYCGRVALDIGKDLCFLGHCGLIEQVYLSLSRVY